jgi:hypothetical protein
MMRFQSAPRRLLIRPTLTGKRGGYLIRTVQQFGSIRMTRMELARQSGSISVLPSDVAQQPMIKRG